MNDYLVSNIHNFYGTRFEPLEKITTFLDFCTLDCMDRLTSKSFQKLEVHICNNF